MTVPVSCITTRESCRENGKGERRKREHQEGLEMVVFECDCPDHAAQFKTTLKELALYVEHEFKGGEEIGYIFRERKDVTATLPPKPTGMMDEYDKMKITRDQAKRNKSLNN